MFRIPTLGAGIAIDPADHVDVAAALHRSNRRRLTVFLAVFLLILVPGLVWNLTPPPNYLASAKVTIASGIVTPQT